MTKRIALLRTLAVAAMVVALGGAAFGADAFMSVASVTTSNDAAGTSATEHAAVDLPSVAASVMSALVGGTNPSTVVAQRDSHANVTQANEDENGVVSNGQALGQTGTPGTRPGWGCGDKNHTHSGPPGRPNASPPPGCNKP